MDWFIDSEESVFMQNATGIIGIRPVISIVTKSLAVKLMQIEKDVKAYRHKIFYNLKLEPPIDKMHCLLHCKNTLITPHTAFATKESMDLSADIVFENLKSWMNGKQKNIILSP